MSEVIAIIGGIVWLALGGWAFGTIVKGGPGDEKLTPEAAAMLFGMCVFFAPFVAGAAWTLKRKEPAP